jgi:SH3-like domain-containing protein
MALRICGLILSVILAIYGLIGPGTSGPFLPWLLGERSNTIAPPAQGIRGLAVKVLADKLNVRRAATASSEILGAFQKGDEVVIVEEGDADWVKVSNASIEGWVKRSFLEGSKN